METTENPTVHFQTEVPAMGSRYRVVEHDSAGYEVQVAPMTEDGAPNDEWAAIGGGVGLPSAEFKTLGAAFGFVSALEDGDALTDGEFDEEKFWNLVEEWEGR